MEEEIKYYKYKKIENLSSKGKKFIIKYEEAECNK